MKALTFAMRSFGRELRSGEVVVLLSAVILAVAALTAVGFLTDRIGKAVERQANEVLAADLRLRSQDPIPDAWRDLAAEYELRTADMVSFPTVVFAGDDDPRIPSPMHGGIWPPSTSSVPRTWCRFPRSCSRETRVH
jgi:putative ABC transport system permease protein